MILLFAVVTLLLWRRYKNKESVNHNAVGRNSGLQIELTNQVREENDLPDNSGSNIVDNKCQTATADTCTLLSR